MPSPIAQLLSRTEYAGDGVTTSWEFSFSGGYLDRDHVKAYTETSTGFRTPLTIMPGDFTGDYTLNLGIVPVDTTLLIYRDTPKDLPLVDFVDGGRVTEASLDLIAKQAVFIAAETVDTVNALDVAAAVDAAASAAISAVAASASAVAAAAAGNAATAAIAADLAAAVGAIAADRASATGAIASDRASALAAIAADVLVAQAARDAAIAASFINTNPTALQSINGGQLSGFRNRVINGGCMVQQRATVPLSASPQIGNVDRYLVSCNGSGLTGTVQQVTATDFTATGTGVGLVGSWTSGAPQIEHRIETLNVVDLNGKTVTISGMLYHSFGTTRNCVVRLNRPTTTYDVFSAQTTIATSAPFAAPTGVATPFSLTVALGSADASRGLAIQVFDNAASTVSSKVFAISGLQLEIGSVATTFEQRPIGLELALCQRYYEVLQTAAGALMISGYAPAASTGIYQSFAWKVTKRVAPTVTVVGSWAVTNAGQPVIGTSDIHSFRLNATSIASGNVLCFDSGGGSGVIGDSEL